MEELQNRIGELIREVQDLADNVGDLRKLRDKDNQAVVRVQQKTARTTTWIVFGLLAVLLLAVLMFAVNRVTLQQAQRDAQTDLTHQIVTCFLRPGDATPAEAEDCARRNGGVLYAQRQRESAAALKRFADLQQWAKSKGWEPPPLPKE